jgi:porin
MSHIKSNRRRTVLCLHMPFWSIVSGLFLLSPPAAAADEPAIVPHTASKILQADDVRAAWAARGLTYGFIYTGEALNNVSGGLSRGSVYQGKLEGFVAADFEKLIGWHGLSFYANGFQLHSSGRIARDRVGNINTVSNIEALPTTRLSEMWLEQKVAADTFGVRFGQLAADTEFFVSDYSALFLTSDWPAIAKHSLPNGGPAYPLSTPGIRIKYEPEKRFAFLAAVFNGDPSGPGANDAEEKNRYGLNFRVNDPPFVIAEMQWRTNQDKDVSGLAGILRLGAWYHFGKFDDQRWGTDGLSLADPAGNGVARRLPGNHGIYAVIDQQIYRPTGGDAESGIGVFSRISAGPSDRNLINIYVDGGIVASGMLSGRPEDKFGVTFIYSRISDSVRGLDRDTVLYGGIAQPIRDYELTLELSYLAQIRPGWTLQPDFQYIVHPGGRLPHPDPSVDGALKNAMVFGLRSVIKY